ncbi:unnamed protein product, partial [Cyprideis torosa]
MRPACPICFDNLAGVLNAVATPCGHVFHTTCLDNWMNNSVSCPSCRLPFARTNLTRLFFNGTADPGTPNPVHLEGVQRFNQEELVQQQKKVAELQLRNSLQRREIAALQDSLQLERSQVENAERATRRLQEQQELDLKRVEGKMNQQKRAATEKMKAFETIQKLVRDNEEEAQKCLPGFETATEPARSLAISVAALRHDLKSLKKDHADLKRQAARMRVKAVSEQAELIRMKKLYRESREFRVCISMFKAARDNPEELLLKLEEARHRLENTQEQLQLQEKKRCKAEEIADDYQMKVKAENKALKKYQQEAAKLRGRANALETVKKLLSDNEEEAQRCLAGFETATEPARSLASSVAVLRHHLKSLAKRNSELKTTLLKTRAAAASDELELSQTKRLLEKEKNKVINSERDCEILHMENKSLREKVRKLEESIVSPSANPKNAALRRLLHESPAPSLDDISIIGCASGSA